MVGINEITYEKSLWDINQGMLLVYFSLKAFVKDIELR